MFIAYHICATPLRWCGVVIKSMKDLNKKVVNDSVSEDLASGPIITEIKSQNYKEIIKLNFGDYMYVHKSRKLTNNNENRTLGAIALYPSGNTQGSWHFMSLDTGKRIYRYQWDVLPASRDVIARVEEIAITQG